MGREQSPLEDFIDVMSRIPWWLNLILAFLSYAILHKLAMSYYDPAPKNLGVGQMGEYAVSKMLPAIALFAQFVMPFAFILAGFGGVVRKFKITKEYKELLLYIAIVLVVFGTIVSQSGGIHKSMMQRVEDPKKQEINQVSEEKIYSWINDKGNRVYSNKPKPE